MSKKVNLYDNRRFLNKGRYHSIAAVGATLEYSEEAMEDLNEYFSPFTAEFSISNCDKTIILSIDTESLEDIDNSIYKLQQIEDVVVGLKAALMASKPTIEEWQRKVDHKKEQNKTKKEE
jgi:nitrate reductase NapAB chaperone NapD